MNDNDKKIFETIKERAKQDRELWHEAQKVQNIGLTLEREEAIIERMFLLYFTEKYLEQEKEIERLEDGLKSIKNYTVDKKCAYCSQVNEYSRRTLHGERIENKFTNPK
jgi:biotin synthase-like enzyme